MEDRGDELDLLLVALAELLGPPVGVVGDPEAGQPVARPTGGLGARQAVERADEDELVEHLHARVQPAFLGQVAPGPARHRPRGHAVPGRRALVGVDDVEDDPHRRRLPCAVGPEEAEHLPGLRDEADAVERLHRAEALADRVDDERHRASLPVHDAGRASNTIIRRSRVSP